MKSIDLFEALNDIPADILLSAEARYTAEPQRRIDRRSGFTQSGWFVAGVSIAVALGVIVLIMRIMPHLPASPSPTPGGSIAGYETNADGLHTEPDTYPDTPPNAYPNTAVLLSELPDDKVRLSSGAWGVQPTMTLLNGLWIGEDGLWTGIDVDIDQWYFLDIEPTLYIGIGADRDLLLHLPDGFKAETFALYQADENNQATRFWTGSGIPDWCLRTEDGAERTLNTGVFYLTFGVHKYGRTVDGETEHWYYEAAVRLVVTENPSGQDGTEPSGTTTTEPAKPVVIPPDTSVPVSLIPDGTEFWWEIIGVGDGARGIVAGKHLVSCLITTPEGQVCGDMNPPIEQFNGAEKQPTLHVDTRSLSLKFHKPQGYVGGTKAYLMDENGDTVQVFSLDDDGTFVLTNDKPGDAVILYLGVDVIQYVEPAAVPDGQEMPAVLDEYRFEILIRLVLR